jgi:hypothetical protein
MVTVGFHASNARLAPSAAREAVRPATAAGVPAAMCSDLGGTSA